jgi:formylglycine-generating enzyme required for sulfatase activity
VIRGGSWYYIPELSTCTDRDALAPDYRIDDVGFRLALSPE